MQTPRSTPPVGDTQQEDRSMTAQTVSHARPQAKASRLVAIAVLAGLGFALVFISGFARPQALHNAAHDSRHSLSFPCH
jgi:cobalt transporter subunit CbtB